MSGGDEEIEISDEATIFLPEVSDEDIRGELIVYRDAQGTPVVELGLYDGQAWLTQEQMATLYQTDRSVISKHLRNLYEEGEIVTEATCEFNAQVHLKGC